MSPVCSWLSASLCSTFPFGTLGCVCFSAKGGNTGDHEIDVPGSLANRLTDVGGAPHLSTLLEKV